MCYHTTNENKSQQAQVELRLDKMPQSNLEQPSTAKTFFLLFPASFFFFAVVVINGVSCIF